MHKRYFIRGSYTNNAGGTNTFWLVYRMWIFSNPSKHLLKVIRQKEKLGSDVMIEAFNRV